MVHLMHKMHSNWDFPHLPLHPACSPFASLSYLIFIVLSQQPKALQFAGGLCFQWEPVCVCMFLTFFGVHFGLFGPCLGRFNLFYCLEKRSTFKCDMWVYKIIP